MIDPGSESVAKLHQLLGAHLLAEARTRFCVWAPTHEQVYVDLVAQNRRVAMSQLAEGYHVAEIEGVAAGDLYRYIFGGSDERGSDERGSGEEQGSPVSHPDPASRYQPSGVHGPSMVVARDDCWTDGDWKGVRREDLVVYELHVGAYTEQGTYLAAIDRLDELTDLGITAIELMPLADAPGRWNWGYDGVHLFAPNRNYGTRDELCRLIDAAHRKGLAVFLDVVYNHLGPEGNYLADCGPYLSARHTTVWGAAPNFDDHKFGHQLRRFFIANAIHWLDEFHFDGLRIDAIHCMRDESPKHIVADLSRGVQAWTRLSGRHAMLIAESNVYDPNMLAPLSEAGMGFDAEWCDDFLHSVYAVARPDERLCHRHYRRGDDLVQTLRYGFVHEGTLRAQRGRKSPTRRIDTSGLVYSIQNHDSIGNHPLGSRLHQLTSLDYQRGAAALLLLSPAIPMIFMGEEFACEHPFQFFIDFSDESMRQAVVEGRKREYPQHDWSGGTLPIDDNAFLQSKIGSPAKGCLSMRDWYRQLLRRRKDWRLQGLLRDDALSVYSDIDAGWYAMRYAWNSQVATVAVQLSAVGTNDASIRLDERFLGDPLGTMLLDSRPDTTATNELRANHAKVFLLEAK